MRPVAFYDDANRRPVPGRATTAAALGAGGGEGLVDQFQGVADVEAGGG